MEGRVVLDAGNFADAATTRTNIYVTSDIYPLGGGTLLPSTITGTFTSPQRFPRFDTTNGSNAANFTITVFNSARTAVSVSSVRLTGNSDR